MQGLLLIIFLPHKFNQYFNCVPLIFCTNTFNIKKYKKLNLWLTVPEGANNQLHFFYLDSLNLSAFLWPVDVLHFIILNGLMVI